MTSLPDILKGVDWEANIDAAYADAEQLEKVDAALLRIAVWSKQLEIADEGNPALCFARETQVAAQQAVALLGLCVYKSCASASRTLVETCLYYTYFRTHPEELTTLVRDDKYYVSKGDVLDYHRLHTHRFSEYQDGLGLVGKLEKWYSQVSAVTHGQIPGSWNTHSSLSEVGFDPATHLLALKTFLEGEEIMHRLLLCTSGRHLWDGFAPDARAYLTKGLAGEKKALLGLGVK